MTRRLPDFKSNDSGGTAYYDIIGDYELIEASFAQQYGIRLRRENEMCWDEYCTLLAGLNEKTPLGKIVSIRSEKDPKIIKSFSPEQKRIRAEWQRKALQHKVVNPEEYAKTMQNLENMFAAFASS